MRALPAAAVRVAGTVSFELADRLATAHGLPVVLALFTLYGLYAAATESLAKAWLAHLVPPTEIGTALGFYGTLQSLGALGASLLTGLLWQRFGRAAAMVQDLRTRRQQDRDKGIFQLLTEKFRPGFEVSLINGLPQGARVLAQRYPSQVAAS